ncbi:MAG: feruloyl-CoA hydratase/lyase [Alphaproteobacteria bacterium]|jgi:trans-feruloyl-CoA hydratase/vanillin synthase|nr:feruloyl-CoA hydratase/lyase [Alphaproteobacteria bacterium]
MTGKNQMARKKKYETILVDNKDGITWVTFNRPDQRNAMSPQLHMDMDDVLDDLAIDPKTEVLVITGAGKAFSAGQDIKLYFRGTASDPAARQKARRASNQWRWQKLSTFPKPTIAMVNGFCFGGAFTQVCACDFAFAADEALFGLSEINWGILPGGIVAWNVTQMLNFRNALYYAMTGDTFDGKKAQEIGFVNFSVPGSELTSATTTFAKKLMEKSPAAMRYTKECIRSVRFMNEPQAADYLNAKSDALKFNDKEGGREEGMKQFLDEKTYRPGFGHYKRKKR